MSRYHVMSFCLAVGLVAGCSPDRAPRTGPTPSPSGATGVGPSGTSTSGPAVSGSGPTVHSPRYLVAIREGTLFATLITDPSARQVTLTTADRAVVSPGRRYLATTDAKGVAIHRLQTGTGVPQLTHVATVAKGVGVALDDVEAVVAVPTRSATHEHDCAIPTQLVKVTLETGARGPLGNAKGTVIPARLVPGGMISSAPTVDCSSSRVMRTDLPSGESRPAYGEGETLLLDVDGASGDVWLRLPRDAQHPHGRQVVVDSVGKVKAEVPEFGVAQFGPQGVVAYTVVHFGPAGTESFYFPVRTELRVGQSIPRTGDRSRDLPDATNLVFAPDGSVVLSAADPRDDGAFRAFSCAPRSVERCSALPLSWREPAIDLVAVV